MSNNQTLPRHRINRSSGNAIPTTNRSSQNMNRVNPRRRYFGNPIRIKKRNKSLATSCFQLFILFSIVGIYFAVTKSEIKECIQSDIRCPDKYYSNSYNEARNKFLKYSSNIRNSSIYNLPIITIQKEYKNETLYTDITIINEESLLSDHLIIHISGIHGIEAYPASAIQCSILDALNNNNDNKNKINKNQNKMTRSEYSKLMHYGLLNGLLLNNKGNEFINKDGENNNDEFPVIMFVHSINPFGMYYKTRYNENNVDLNRNLKSDKEWKEFNNNEDNDHDDIVINSYLNPVYSLLWMVGFTDKYVPFSRIFMWNWVSQYLYSYIINWYYKTVFNGYYLINFNINSDNNYNINKLFKQFVIGQNNDRHKLQYVGNKEKKENSHVIFEKFLADKFSENNWNKQFKKITLIDVHTGYAYGKKGSDILNVRHQKEVDRIRTVIPHRAARVNTYDNDDIYKNVNGMTHNYMDFIINDLMNISNNIEECDIDNLDYLSIQQTIGTFSMEQILNAVRFEHAYSMEYKQYLHDMDNDDQQQILISRLMKFLVDYSKQELMHVYNPKEVSWKANAIRRGYQSFRKLYAR